MPEPPTPEPPVPGSNPLPRHSTRLPVVDDDVITRLMADVGDDPAFVRELINAFVAAAPGLLATAMAAADAGDAPSLRRAVHTLKANAASLGAVALAEVAHVVERKAAENRPPSETDRIALERHVGEAIEALNEAAPNVASP